MDGVETATPSRTDSEEPELTKRKRLAPAFAVLLSPLLVFGLAHLAGSVMLPEKFLPELKPWCLVRLASEAPLAPHDDCSRGAQQSVSPAPGGVLPAVGQVTGATAGAKPAGTAAAGPAVVSTTASGVPKTPSQARAKELMARLDFAAGTALLWVAALLATVLALIGGWQGWSSREQPSPEEASERVSERPWVVAFYVIGLGAGVIVAYLAHIDNPLRSLLQNDLLKAAQNSNVVANDAVALLETTGRFNLLISYGASGLLLGYLAALSIDSPHPISVESRVISLQFVLVAGAAIFTASVLTNKAAIGWISGTLDPASSGLLIDALKKVADFVGLASSLLLVTAIGAAYFAIRGKEASVGPGELSASTSVLALRTADGKDFKALGWVINLLIAFAPVWFSETIFQNFNLFQLR